MRLVYCGSPDEAVPPLEALVAAGHDVALVVTQPDRRRSRGGAPVPTPVARAATRLGLDLRAPGRVVEVLDEVQAIGADLGVVVAYGRLLPPPLLAAIPRGFLNVHFSLLPRWRGAAPVQRAILAGDPETGVCIMQLEEGLDTGPVYASSATPVGAEETAGELRDRLVTLGTALLLEVLNELPGARARAQEGAAVMADKLSVEEFRLDPMQTASTLARVVRAGNPRPGAWTVVGGRRLKVHRAHALDSADIVTADEGGTPGSIDRDARLRTSAGLLVLDEVQPEGKAVMTGAAWRAGQRDRQLILDEVDRP